VGMPGSRGLPNRRSPCAAAPLTLNTVAECLLRSRSIATYDSPELAELNHSLTTAFNPEPPDGPPFTDHSNGEKATFHTTEARPASVTAQGRGALSSNVRQKAHRIPRGTRAVGRAGNR
jgi:hypothetical protein